MSCEATPDNLAILLDFVAQGCLDAGLDEDARFAIRLAGEEVCCNVIHHAYRGRQAGPIALHLRCSHEQAVLEVEDLAPPFNPADAPPPDLSLDLESRAIGGLGWHLVRAYMDEVQHEPTTGGGNRLVLVKRLHPGSQST